MKLAVKGSSPLWLGICLGTLLTTTAACDDGDSTSATTTSGGGAAAGSAGHQPGGGGVGGGGGAGGDVPAGGGPGGVPLDGFGVITGSCGVIDPDDLGSPQPWYIDNTIDFGTVAYDYSLLSDGGKEVYDDGNLGGSSIYSEVFSYEVLYRCELADLVKTEGEITYQDPGGKKTDLLVDIDGQKVGVSVTRAYKYTPPNEPSQAFEVAEALDLLSGKLDDILLSTANVGPGDAWTKQILHVMAYNDQHAASLAEAYGQIDASTKADTIVMVTVTEGDDEIIY